MTRLPIRPLTILISIFCLLLVIGGCDYAPLGYTPIGEIVRNPGSYEGSSIKIKGEVTDITKLPLLELKSYTLRDDSGEVLVLTEENLPVLNKKLAIQAHVKTTAIISGQSFGLRLVELKRLPLLWY